MILVTAATAPVGRSIVEQLVAAGIPVRTLTRDPGKADLPAGAEIVAGDLGDPDSLAAALTGVEAAFLLAVVPGVGPGFVAAAQRAGVKRIVFQSTAEIDDDAERQRDEVAAAHHEIEQIIVDAGLQWTFLRLDVASADALQWAFDVPGQLAAGDVVRGPYAEAAGSPIHTADFAAIAVAALTGDEHVGRKYHVTGPRSLTHREQIELVGHAHGRHLRYVELDPAAARSAMSPYAPADLLFAAWERYLGRPAPVTDTIYRVTGRPPRTVEEWAAAYPAC
ncbi:NAD(P)H-binding protein [Amorphoplanes digitatis]|uniref:Uncharacterized protein YbjT (DUF2867 family) n=1 Tax=Actinoplanes digitatis TaxID=1868 RepID=A0A7W7MSJ9_9ACTN|nr:NAD(P)H-binding protein [Actinoplanes digitatis]MBB4764750.1 uncharacterized protein YbjT (DUF2867 family) [Actinoplanes digitatis]GID91297.1 nucleotide-diphosphate-sugar epimerase [Actinoplanes digitatis]